MKNSLIRTILAGVAFAACLGASGAWPQAPGQGPAQQQAAELDRLLAADDIAGLQARMFKPASSAEAVASLDWAKARTMEGKTIAVPMLYAQLLWRVASGTPELAHLKESAALIAMYALLVAHADGVKCDDETAPPHRVDGILRTLQGPLRVAAEADDAKRRELVDSALAMERKTAALRGDDSNICRFGLQETRDTETYRAEHNLGGEGTQTQPGPGGVGKTTVVPAIPGYQPRYRPREEWEGKQAAVRQTFPELLTRVLAGGRAASPPKP